jgi:hypothetical protein
VQRVMHSRPQIVVGRCRAAAAAAQPGVAWRCRCRNRASTITVTVVVELLVCVLVVALVVVNVLRDSEAPVHAGDYLKVVIRCGPDPAGGGCLPLAGGGQNLLPVWLVCPTRIIRLAQHFLQGGASSVSGPSVGPVVRSISGCVWNPLVASHVDSRAHGL